MVDYLYSLVCIDRDRVFAGGFSNGAILSYALSCLKSDLVRTARESRDNLPALNANAVSVC